MKDPRKALDGEYGEAYQKAAEIIIALAKAYDAEDFIPIYSAHVSGISYLNVGDAGVEIFESLSEAKVEVLTTVNPMGFDPDEPWTLPENYEKIIEGQRRILNALGRMGADVTLTCTPYYLKNRPPRGSHIARAESSAVVYANSILGAYTNREAGISALASAILGVTPKYGLHLEENREPEIFFKLDYIPSERYERSALGIFIGKHNKTVVGLSELPKDEDAFKLLGASAAASGRVALITNKEADDVVSVGKEEIKETIEALSSGEDPEFYYVGCPHASENELIEFSKKCSENWILSLAPELYERNRELIEKIRKRGCKVIKGTCIVVSILRSRPFVTDSGKAARYCPKASLGKVL